MNLSLIWNGWDSLAHTLVIVVAGATAIVVMLRISGPRTLAQMSPLDFIVAVTIGATFGRTITAVEVPLTQLLFGVTLLVLMQWFLAAIRARFPRARRALDHPPVLLYYRGQFQGPVLRRHRLLERDIHTAVRLSGRGSLQDVAAVILQQDGTLGVIGEEALGDGSSLLPYVQTSGPDAQLHGEEREQTHAPGRQS